MRLKKKSWQPDKEGLAAQYKEMSGSLAESAIFDGRGSGVDVYTCTDCGERFYTQYVDKGVTPFTVACRKCGGIARHDHTIRYSEWRGWKENPILVPQDRVESFRKTASDLGIPVLVEGVWSKEKED